MAGPLRLISRLVMGRLLRPHWMVETFAQTLLKHGIPHFENFTTTRGGPIIMAAKGDHRAGRAALCRKDIR
jgi:L-lactate dehydrogenase (cytochrome)